MCRRQVHPRTLLVGPVFRKAKLAPPDRAVLCAMAYGAPADDVVDRLDQLVATAGVEPSTVLERRVLSSMTVAHGAPRPHRGLGGRPAVTVAGTDNCFLAGDWVGAKGLLADAALTSGLAAGTAAAQR
jgi:hypothetical protein